MNIETRTNYFHKTKSGLKDPMTAENNGGADKEEETKI